MKEKEKYIIILYNLYEKKSSKYRRKMECS